MRFFKIICLLLAGILPLRAQLPPQLPPGGVVQLMVQQPPVDVSPADRISALAFFDPPLIPAGGKSLYRVTVEATENSVAWPYEIVTSPGLQLDEGIHGQVSRVDGNQFHPLTSFVYEATAAAPGHFVISNFVVQVAGQSVVIPAAALDVSADQSVIVPERRRLWLEVSATNLFFGEPFRVRVLLPAGAGNQIEALNEVQFNGSGYMTDKIATRQAVEMTMHNGQPGLAYYFETVATPLATGPVQISAQGFAAGRNLSGPITINGPGQVVISGSSPAYTLLSSEPVRLNVRPLPAEGQLPGFTGALGKFHPNPAQLAVRRLHVGEPVHLQYGFSGGTNLTRFVRPDAPRSRDWQVFADPPPATGFTLIPLTDEVAVTPAIPFCAFDPATEKYYDLTIPSLSVTVTNDGLPLQSSTWQAGDTNLAPLKLSGLALTPGRTAPGLRPLQLQGWFILLQLMPVLVFLALWRWDERRRFLDKHPEIMWRRRARRLVRRERRLIMSAVRNGDEPAFVRSAAQAMQMAAMPYYRTSWQALISTDVLAQLDEADRAGCAGKTVEVIFAAVHSKFARVPEIRTGLLELYPDVETVLGSLEGKA